MWVASTTFGTVTSRPANPPRCHPSETPRSAGSERSTQRVSAVRPPGPSVAGGPPSGDWAAAATATMVTHAARAASEAFFREAVTSSSGSGGPVDSDGRPGIYPNNRHGRSERRRDRGLVLDGEHLLQQQPGARLGERLVEVAALRRLHAGGAAARARALGDQTVRVATQLLEAAERR